ncbi:hypothetical protein WJ972_05425 [Achromobacter insuavis]
MRYAVLALLSCQQYLAIAFLYAAVPAVLRQRARRCRSSGCSAWCSLPSRSISCGRRWWTATR